MSYSYGSRSLRDRGPLQSPARINRLAPLLVNILGTVLTTGMDPVFAYPSMAEVCHVNIEGDPDPIPNGSERGVKVHCIGFRTVDFSPKVQDGLLSLSLAVRPELKRLIEAHPLQCTVEGSAFEKPAKFHCPTEPDDKPKLAPKPVRWGLHLRYQGNSKPPAPFVLSIDGTDRTIDSQNTYMFDTEVRPLLSHGVLHVNVQTLNLQATFTLRASQFTPDRSILPLMIEHCAEESIVYNLFDAGLKPNDLRNVDPRELSQREFAVMSQRPEQAGRTPRIKTANSNSIEIVWPPNYLCRDPEVKPPELRIELPELQRELHLKRDGHVDLSPASGRSPPIRFRLPNHAPQWTLHLEGEPSGSSFAVEMPGVGKAPRITEGSYRIHGGMPRLISLAYEISNDCQVQGSDRTCAVVDRSDLTIKAQWGQTAISTPFGMRLDLMRGTAVETMEGTDALGFASAESLRRIDAWPVESWPAQFVAPGYWWRVATGELTATVSFHVDKRKLVTGVLSLPVSKRLRDPVYWALRSHGWRSDSAWISGQKLDRYDPIAQIATFLTKLPDINMMWEDYVHKIVSMAMDSTRDGPSSSIDQVLPLHVSAAALLLRARTSSKATDYFGKACKKANTAWGQLLRSKSPDVSVKVDLALVRMEACLCAGILTQEDANTVIHDLGSLADEQPYRELYLDLKYDLDRNTRNVCAGS